MHKQSPWQAKYTKNELILCYQWDELAFFISLPILPPVAAAPMIGLGASEKESLKMHLFESLGRRIFNWMSPVLCFLCLRIAPSCLCSLLQRGARRSGDLRAAPPALLSLKQAMAPPFSRSACVGATAPRRKLCQSSSTFIGCFFQIAAFMSFLAAWLKWKSLFFFFWLLFLLGLKLGF